VKTRNRNKKKTGEKKVESSSSMQPFEDFGQTCIFPLGVGFKKKDDNLQMAKVINWLINWYVAIGIQTTPLITFSRLLSVEVFMSTIVRFDMFQIWN
jgi:hypothetical protein